jgi:hypothetical protein
VTVQPNAAACTDLRGRDVVEPLAGRRGAAVDALDFGDRIVVSCQQSVDQIVDHVAIARGDRPVVPTALFDAEFVGEEVHEGCQ